MSTFEREVVAGSCGEPQPGNWRDACRRPGHSGEHHARISRGYVLARAGSDYPVRSTSALRGHGAYVGTKS